MYILPLSTELAVASSSLVYLHRSILCCS